MRSTLKRLASGRLGSTKGRDGSGSVDAPAADPSYVVLEPRASAGAAEADRAAQEKIAELQRRLDKSESQLAAARNHVKEAQAQRSKQQQENEALRSQVRQLRAGSTAESPVTGIATAEEVPASHEPEIPTSAGGVAPAAADPQADEWTIAAWLGSLDLASAVEAALASAVPEGSKPLDALREPALTRPRLDELMQHAGLAGLSEVVWAALVRLRRERTATEMQDKFMQDGANMLEYAGLDIFYGGLEGQIGAPPPKIREAMATEHTADGGDRHDEFTSGNYDVTTTSAIEYAFVATPEATPAAGWPIEKKLVRALRPTPLQRTTSSAALIASGAKMRTPLPITEMQVLVSEKNALLEADRQTRLLLEEAIGARLYTGPLFVKYNGVLRGLNSAVPFLVSSMVKLCCAKAVADAFAAGTLSMAQAKQQVNKYTTTLHCINSAILKLSKLTVATKVYRGISGMVLPQQFREANKHGVRGGIESAFMSTTVDREVALSYAASGARGGFVFEIRQGARATARMLRPSCARNSSVCVGDSGADERRHRRAQA